VQVHVAPGRGRGLGLGWAVAWAGAGAWPGAIEGKAVASAAANGMHRLRMAVLRVTGPAEGGAPMAAGKDDRTSGRKRRDG